MIPETEQVALHEARVERDDVPPHPWASKNAADIDTDEVSVHVLTICLI